MITLYGGLIASQLKWPTTLVRPLMLRAGLQEASEHARDMVQSHRNSESPHFLRITPLLQAPAMRYRDRLIMSFTEQEIPADWILRA